MVCSKYGNSHTHIGTVRLKNGFLLFVMHKDIMFILQHCTWFHPRIRVYTSIQINEMRDNLFSIMCAYVCWIAMCMWENLCMCVCMRVCENFMLISLHSRHIGFSNKQRKLCVEHFPQPIFPISNNGDFNFGS